MLRSNWEADDQNACFHASEEHAKYRFGRIPGGIFFDFENIFNKCFENVVHLS